MAAEAQTGGNKIPFTIHDVFVGAAVIGMGYAFYTYIIKPNKDENDVDKNLDKPEYQIASQIAAALNPSGVSFFRKFDGTDENPLYSQAKAMREQDIPFSEVAKAFKKIDGRGLENRLKSELAASEYKQFYQVYNLSTSIKDPQKKAPEGAKVQAKVNDVIITISKTNLRKTPIAGWKGWTSHKGYYENVFDTVDANECIGVFTGKTALQPNSDNGAILWYNVRTFKSLKGDGKKPYTKKSFDIWVAASNIKAVTVPPTVKTYTQWVEFLKNIPSGGSFVIDEKAPDNRYKNYMNATATPAIYE
jgi:hypothetical protein